jgi:hypothetical protein
MHAEVLDDSISCVGPPISTRRRSKSEDGLEYIGFGEMMRRKELEVISTMIVMSRLMMNFSRENLSTEFHP